MRADECPACAFVANAERSVFSWFVTENHASPVVQAQLRASMGMCAAHCRRLVEDPGPGPVLTTVAGAGIAGARACLRGEIPAGPCLVCASLSRSAGDVADLLTGALKHEDALRRRYTKHRGVCLDHVFSFADVASPDVMTVITQGLLSSLSELDAQHMLHLLTSTDRDSARRARWRACLPDAPRPGSTTHQLCDQLRVDACPICLAGSLGERRYLEWWAEAARLGEPSLANDPGGFCSGHLHDLALADPVAVTHAIDRRRVATMRALEQLLAQLSAPSRTSKRRRGDEPAGRHEVQTILSPLHPCPACRARRTAEHRQAELIDAAMALSEVRATYESGHGLCVRHLPRLASPTATEIAKRVADARLAVLQWELEEIRRKYAWQCRHESPGPERDAWLRAFSQIDGRVLLGAPYQGIAPSS